MKGFLPIYNLIFERKEGAINITELTDATDVKTVMMDNINKLIISDIK